MSCQPNGRSSVALALTCAVLLGCTQSQRHTSDAELKRRFFRQQQGFEELLREVQEDEDLQAIELRFVVYAGRQFAANDPAERIALDRLGLTSQRLERYERQLRGLKLLGGALKRHEEVEFRADPGSLFNGDSYKGYAYRPTPPPRLVSGLDTYHVTGVDRTASGDWRAYVPLSGDWYLYLFVNR
jgi:hypothetical protein